MRKQGDTSTSPIAAWLFGLPVVALPLRLAVPARTMGEQPGAAARALLPPIPHGGRRG